MKKQASAVICCLTLFGCASPSPKLEYQQKPTYVQPQVLVQGGASTQDRLQFAEVECKKLGEIYQAALATHAFEMTNKRRLYDRFWCEVKPQRSVTALEFRALQSRLFKTSAVDLGRAIETFIKDQGGICARVGQPRFLPGGVGVGGSHLAENELECKTGTIQYNSELLSVQSGVILRTRIYVYSLTRPSVQLTDPTYYSALFKSIADQLFIEAIQIDPAEMR